MDDNAAKMEAIQSVLVSSATGGFADDLAYQALRKYILGDPLLKELAPAFLKDCRSLDEFWPFIKGLYGHYAERRKFVWDSFRPMFERIEETSSVPSDQSVSEILQTFDPESIHRIWLRAMDRRDADPEGAITLARTLLESVCKHILGSVTLRKAAKSASPTFARQCFRQKTVRSMSIPPVRQHEVDQLPMFVDCTEQVFPSAAHLDVGLVHSPRRRAIALVRTHLLSSSGA